MEKRGGVGETTKTAKGAKWGEGKIAFHAKASRGERVKLGGVSEFGTQELMKERWGGGSGEQPCLPQRSPTFAKASAGKQSFTERGF
jgi:hypothetical protein